MLELKLTHVSKGGLGLQNLIRCRGVYNFSDNYCITQTGKGHTLKLYHQVASTAIRPYTDPSVCNSGNALKQIDSTNDNVVTICGTLIQ